MASPSSRLPRLQLHSGQPGVLRLPNPPEDGSPARLLPRTTRCAAPSSHGPNGTFYGGQVLLLVERAMRFDCHAHFGILCAPNGVTSLPPGDIALARAAELRLYVYTELPPRFHSELFSSQMPPDVRMGEVCDFVRQPCTPPPPQNPKVGYKAALVRWFTGMKHAADVPLLAKLLALCMVRSARRASVPGLRTLDPSRADLFVVPFLGGFIERDSPDAAYALNRQAREGRGVMRDLFSQLSHYNATTATRHLFLLTNSCGGCNRQKCDLCSSWQSVPTALAACPEDSASCGPRLALTLGPNSPLDTPTRLRQVLVPPNIMEEELHTPRWKPLCRGRTTTPAGSAFSFSQHWRQGSLKRWFDESTKRSEGCHRGAAQRDLMLFYQGGHAMNSLRSTMLTELHEAVFNPKHNPGVCGCGSTCDCASQQICCVNQKLGVAYFYSKSHFLPVTPLSFAETIQWMQHSRFCLCPPGDVPYNKRYFTALLSGCVPVVFSFRNKRGQPNWWKRGRGTAAHVEHEPFWSTINHSSLVVELDGENGITGFLGQLQRISLDEIERKQRRIDAVRHLLLFDTSGSQPDAFSVALRELMAGLASRGPDERLISRALQREAPLLTFSLPAR